MIHKCVITVLLFFLSATASILVEGATIKNLRASTSPEKTRLVLDLSASVRYELQTLTGPDRLVLTVKNAQLPSPFSQNVLARLRNTPVSSLDANYQNNNDLQIVINLKYKVRAKSFVLPPAEKYPYRLVIDLTPSNEKVASSLPAVIANTAAVNPPVAQSTEASLAATQDLLPTPLKPATSSDTPVAHATKPSKMAYTEQDFDMSKGKPLIKSTPVVKEKKSWKSIRNTFLPRRSSRDIVVVIDPGHGGKDPGAMGQSGTHEKTVVLQISRQLQQMINREPGFRAVLTRDGDYFIPLRERLNIARRDRADIFVAIHADAFKNTDASGASVFALSERGATSEAARWLAEKENYSELLGGGDLSDKDNMLRSVLIDLSQNHTISVSLQMGNAVLHELSKVSRLHYKRVEQAAFVVLKSPDIPSLLVETGYLSNPRGEAQLRNPAYQQRIAYSIMRGIKAYFINNPPQGSLLSATRYDTPTRYVVTDGDTLPLIAYRYRVNADQIRKMNQLSSDQLQVGQTLWLPPKQRHVPV